MIITVNGEKQTVPGDRTTVKDLLGRAGVTAPDMVSVQVNGEFVDKSQYGSKCIAENDEVDFLYFMGGGRA